MFEATGGNSRTFGGMWRARVVAVVFAAALVVAIPASQAGSVGVSVSSPDTVTFVAKSGETNELDVDIFTPGLVVTDSGAKLTAGAGCVSLGPNSAECDVHPNINAYLGNKGDTARVLWNGVVQIWAGSGNDDVVASSFGAYGVAYGGAGDDEVGVVGEGEQLADGGSGDDVLDVFAFGGQSTGIGGNGRDIIEFHHDVSIGIGAATLDGGNGNDTIFAQPTHSGSSTATGGSGNDVIVLTSVPPLYGTASSYFLSGGTGDDTLIGGASIDTVDGGTGRDAIDVRDGGADTVTCGPGNDVVLADMSDTVSADCETVA